MINLDTTACVDYLNGNKSLQKLLNEQEDLLYTTAITVYEINIGLERTRRIISEQRFRKLNKKWLSFISGMEIFSLGIKEAEKAAKIYDILEKEGRTIDDNDILIISIMLTNGIKKIITKNFKHFNRIKEIEVLTY